MRLPRGATVAVADGERLKLFRNAGDETHPSLAALPTPEIDAAAAGSGGRREDSSANPDHRQAGEDGFAAGVAALLNRWAMEGKIDALVVIAAPRALGELRKHYHQALSAKLVGEIAKDLTGHPAREVEKAIAAA